MPTAAAVYKKIRKFAEEGRDVKSCCRCVAEQFNLEPGEVEVIAAARNREWYNQLGFNVRMKI